MNRKRLFALVALTLSIAAFAAAKQETRTPVAPGVVLIQTVLSADEPGGPLLVHALLVEPKDAQIEAALAGGTVEEAGGGRDVVQKMVTSTGAVAGVNAAFFSFDAGDPLGLHIHKGELVSEPWPGRAAMGFRSNGTAFIGSPTFSASLKLSETQVRAIAGVNRRCGVDELVVYAPIYGARTEADPMTVALLRAPGQTIRAGREVKATVVSVTEDVKAIAPPIDHLVVAGKGPAADWLKANLSAGKDVTLSFSLSEPGSSRDWVSVVEAASGMPSLLANGKPTGDTSGGESFAKTRHPRTAGGVTKDGRFLLVVVDGRQTLSRGASLPELTEIMKGLGAVEAMNFDGGGSSTLSVQGLVINSPSDGSCRRVSDGLIVFGGGRPAVPPEPARFAESLYVFAGAKPVAARKGGDSEASIVWGTANGGAWVSQKGMAHGYKSGSYLVKGVTTDGKRAFVTDIIVLPGEAARLRPAWKDGALEVTVTDANGNGVPDLRLSLTRADGPAIALTTGADGKTSTPDGWLADDKTGVKIRCGALTAAWPPPPPAPEKK